MAYETEKKKFTSKLEKNPLEWPVTLQFFRHARNASFHGNIFDIRNYRGNEAIDSKFPPNWRNLTITDLSINGTRFAGFFPISYGITIFS